MIRTITIEREYGAGGAAIAERLAGQLGWKLWDQSLTAEIARLAKVDQACVERMAERCDSGFYRLMKVFMRGSYERSLPVTGLDTFDQDSMMAFMQRVIEQAADEGKSVIVGRGSPYYLRHRTDAFHVCSTAINVQKRSRRSAMIDSAQEVVSFAVKRRTSSWLGTEAVSISCRASSRKP